MFTLQTHPSKDVQKSMVKHRMLVQIKSATDALIIISESFPKKNSEEQQLADIFDSCFNGRRMT